MPRWRGSTQPGADVASGPDDVRRRACGADGGPRRSGAAGDRRPRCARRTAPCRRQGLASIRSCCGGSRATYADFAEPFESVLVAGHWEDATRQAHTLKGLAASLGANELQPRAARARDSPRGRATSPRRADNLARDRRCLAPLVAALRAPLRRRGPRDTPTDPPGPTRSLGAAGAIPDSPSPPIGCAACATCCSKATSKPRRFGNRDREEIDARLPVARRAAASRIALDNFDFDAALALLADQAADRGRHRFRAQA